jgi:tungstate transport system substrate-binding protein
MKTTPRNILLSLLLVFSVLVTACGSTAPSNPNIILATTTSTQDSGLLDVLVPMFEKGNRKGDS